MADELDVLLQLVEDETLQADLSRLIDRLRAKQRFGLVFEDHVPERVRLPHHPVRAGVHAVRREEPNNETTGFVERVDDGKAWLALRDGSTDVVATDELVVVAEFGQPIYPGFRNVGSISHGGDKPAHVVINGENHHVLEALQFTHAGKVDCIYIDPPYNSGARDWKYDNRYVDTEDAYRHSKWLAFMERRLRLAKTLLNAESSVLIVTIDEKEYLRLGLLLQQVFADANVQMVTSVVNRKGVPRKQGFARVDEYLFFVYVGDVGQAVHTNDMLSDPRPVDRVGELVTWIGLRRRGSEWRRSDRPGSFFPIFVDEQTGQIVDVGTPLPPEALRSAVDDREGCLTIWPLNKKGEESRWQLSPANLMQLLKDGMLRSVFQKGREGVTIEYLSEGQRQQIADGQIVIEGRDEHGAVIARHLGARIQQAKSVWNLDAHGATAYGTQLVSALLPGRPFPYPKSLYAVEDTLRLFLRDKPNAIVLDFFGGSGTTTHAVARLNRQDGGRRHSILVTNNEVSDAEARSLRQDGLCPGDPEWERLGIYEYITKPRVVAAVTGNTPDGTPIKGDYKFVDEFPMSEGLEENVTFLELAYLDATEVELDLAFEAVAPLLWMRAGCSGPIIESRRDSTGDTRAFAITDRYGVLFHTDKWRSFVNALTAGVTTVFIVTDSPTTFTGITAELRSNVEAVRLYENYLTTFTINQRRA